MASTNISKKRKFVADGVFYSELNEVRFLARFAGLDTINKVIISDNQTNAPHHERTKQSIENIIVLQKDMIINGTFQSSTASVSSAC